MNLAKFFTNEGDIAGLEINDSALRLLFLKSTKKSPAPQVIFSLEENLPEGDVVGGEVKNQQNFAMALKRLLAKAKPRIRFVIASIPANGIYTKVFSFPPGVVGEKLDNSIKLATAFQLPKEGDQTYVDWEKLTDEDRNLVLLSLIDKATIDNVVAPLESLGLKVLAVEYHELSLARALTLPADKTVLVIEKNQLSYTFSIIKNKTVRFLRSIPKERLRNGIGAEASRIIDYFEIEGDHPDKIILLGEFSKEEVGSLTAAVKNSEISELPNAGSAPPIVLGAALRGLIPREEDNLISLMELGTEEAYEQKKALTFADFITKMSILIAAFFVLSFAAVWLMMVRIEESFNRQITVITNRPDQDQAAELERKIAAYNGLIAQTSALAKEEIGWSKLLLLISKAVPPGLSITNISMNGLTSPVSIVGVSKDRPILKAFKKNLEDTPEFKEIILPQTNLEKKNDIPFMASFTVVDSSQFNLH